jgi:hypothetical protein
MEMIQKMKVVIEVSEEEMMEILLRDPRVNSMSDADIMLKEQILNNLDIIENAEIRVAK